MEGKLEEHHLLDNAELIEILPGRRFTLGPFSIMPIRVTHSLVDCVALAIHTPVGVVVHSGDFKIDLSSPDGKPFDLHAFAELGKQGVLCLLQDSTNVDRPGYTPSERAVRPRLDEIFAQTKKKLFFSCFSSSIHRITHCDGAGRRAWAQGRGDRPLAGQLHRDCAGPGLSGPAAGLLINPGQLRDMPANKVLVMISGTQGEPMSALSRAAVNNHKYAHIEAGDTVVLSSRIIPGNEKSIYRMIDHLERRDAKVIYDDGTQGLSTSAATAQQEELRLMINLMRPKFFIPIHGDYRHLKRHAELAGAMDIVGEGDSAGGRRDSGAGQEQRAEERQDHRGPRLHRFRRSIDVVEDIVIRDRQHISEDGIVLPIMTINKRTGKVEVARRSSCADSPARTTRADRRGAPGGAAHAGGLQRRGEGATTASSRRRSAPT